jgi:hypothetical protein
MGQTTRDHLEIILHESAVLALKEDGDQIVIQLDVATLSPEHPDNISGALLEVSPAQLELFSVQSSDVQLWSDEKKTFEVVSMRLPRLAEIIEPEHSLIEPDGTLLWIINGFDSPTNRWLEWRVKFKAFRLSWEFQKERSPN